MTMSKGTSSACAACKYQRKKCSKNCPLSPYFPPDEPQKFQYAHRLFGVSNILKILKQVTDKEKDDALKSIIYEADIRAKYPVEGCCLVISVLEHQLRSVREQIYYVQSQLAEFKRQNPEFVPGLSEYDSSSPSNLQLGNIDNNVHDMSGLSFAMNGYYSFNRNIFEPTTTSIEQSKLHESLEFKHEESSISMSRRNVDNMNEEMLRNLNINVSDCADIVDNNYYYDVVDDDDSRHSFIGVRERGGSSKNLNTRKSFEENDLKSAASNFSLKGSDDPIHRDIT